MLLILSLIVGSLYAYLGWRLATSASGWTFLSVPLMFFGAFPFLIISGRSGVAGSPRSARSLLRKGLLHAAFLSMGFLTYLFVFVLFRDGALLAAQLLNWDTGEFLTPFQTAACAFMALFIGSVHAAIGPRLRRVDIPYPELPAELDGMQILQMSDLHVGPTIGRRYVERVVRRALHLKPDLIAMTGDIGDGPVADLRDDLSPLRQLRALAPICYVTGNHEYYWRADQWIAELQRLGAKPLLNEHVTFRLRGHDVLVGGINDPMAAQQGPEHAPDPARAYSAKAAFKILLSHRPDFARAAEKLGFDLQLSGHTHGGQFFPWTLVVRMVHKHALGLMRCGRMWIYVSPGTGSWGPLLRLGTTPELTLIRLRRS
jgi:predicted MPP superfamily phosphohydrolase